MKDEGSRVTAGRNSSPLNTEKTTEFMLTPTTSVSITASESVGVLRMDRQPSRVSRSHAIVKS